MLLYIDWGEPVRACTLISNGMTQRHTYLAAQLLRECHQANRCHHDLYNPIHPRSEESG